MQKTQLEETALTEFIRELKGSLSDIERLEINAPAAVSMIKGHIEFAISLLPKERKQIIDGIQLGYDYYGARYATNKKKIFDITFTQYKP